MSNYLE